MIAVPTGWKQLRTNVQLESDRCAYRHADDCPQPSSHFARNAIDSNYLPYPLPSSSMPRPQGQQVQGSVHFAAAGLSPGTHFAFQLGYSRLSSSDGQ